jgi:hypothetical protein
MTNIFTYSTLRAALVTGALYIAFSAPAQAAFVYDFKFTGGAKSEYASLGFGEQIFVEVAESTLDNVVLFTFTHALPAETTVIAYMYFDTGIYTGLFTDMFVSDVSSGVDINEKSPSTAHPFLPGNFDSDYKFGFIPAVPYSDQTGINHYDEYATLSATLGTGYMYDDVISALNEGLVEASETSGLRIGLFTYHLEGKTQDDGAFVTNSAVVPLPTAWPMMLAGLGLMGLVARRRTVTD